MDAKSSLPEDIIGLIDTSGSKTLEEALQVLIETSRTEIGRANLASNRTLTFVLRLVEELQKLPHSELLLLSMKLLRNLCAETTNQNLFIDGNGTEIVSKCLMTATLCSVPPCGLIRMGLQVLANASLGGSKHQNSIWVRFFPLEFLGLAKIQSQQTIDPLCMIIYACCDGNEAFLVELCGDKGLNIVADIVRTVSFVGFRENWFKLLLSRICLESPHLPTLFSKLYTAVDGEDLKGESFTAAHAFLLSIVAEILNNRLEEVTASTEFASFVLNINKKSAELIDFHLRGKSALPTGSALIDVFGYSLVILRDICAQEGGRAVDSLLSAGFLDFVVNLLSGLEPPAIVRKAENHVRNQEQINSKVCPYKGFRRDIVGTIGNCLFRRKAVQDKIRDKDAICLLLQQCVTDEDNPFLREWGIWAVRNLVLDNEENQKEVMELKIQGSVDVPEVSELGLRVELNSETGRPKLVNCGPYDRVATKPASGMSEVDELASDVSEQDVGEISEPLTTSTEEDKEEDAVGAAHTEGVKLLQEIQIHVVLGRIVADKHYPTFRMVDGMTLISPSEPFMYECKSGRVTECRSFNVRANHLHWVDNVRHHGSTCVVSGDTMFVVGGKTPNDHFPSRDMYFINMKDEERSRHWKQGPVMTIGRSHPIVVSVDDKIYVFGGSRKCFPGRSADCSYWAEVYNIEGKQWSDIELPLGLVEEGPLAYDCPCCVVDEELGHNKKILLFCRLGVYAYDLTLGKWERNYIPFVKFHDINPDRLLRVLQSGGMLFFVESKTELWRVFDLKSKEMLGIVDGILEIQNELPFPKKEDAPYRWMLVEVQSLDSDSCRGGDEVIHKFVVFYAVCPGYYDKEPIYILVARIDVKEEKREKRFSAVLKSFGALKLEEDYIAPVHLYAVASGTSEVDLAGEIQQPLNTITEERLSDKEEDAICATHTEGVKLLKEAGFKIHLVVGQPWVVGKALISPSEPFMYECKSGRGAVWKGRVVGAEGLKLETKVRLVKDFKCVVSGDTMFLVGGKTPDNGYSSEMYFINMTKERKKKKIRRWVEGPVMRVGRIDHSVVSADDKIYVFGGLRKYVFESRWSLCSEKRKDENNYYPWAEVYDIKAGKWSDLDEYPSELALDCPPPGALHCCVVEEKGHKKNKKKKKKKILLLCRQRVFAYDLTSGVWERDYIQKEKLRGINNLVQVVQSGGVLFFVESESWRVFDVKSKEMLGSVNGILEMQNQLHLPKEEDAPFVWELFEVVSLGCHGGISSSGVFIHQFVLFYKIFPGYNSLPVFFHVARINVKEEEESFSARLNSFGTLKVDDGWECHHLYAVAG